MSLTSLASGQESAVRFSHTTNTTASPEAIWAIWTDVANWSEWDTGLQSAELSGDWQEGVKGILVPDEGPSKVKFKVIDYQDAIRAYTFKTSLPLGGLFVKRSLEVRDGKTYFTHEVWFTGLFKKTFAKRLGTRYREMLPAVMEQVARRAEALEELP